MKNIIYILAFFLFSCGSLKKDKTSIETEASTETNAETTTARWIDSKDYRLEPADLSKPMIFTNSKGETETFTNTKVIYNNTHTKEIIHDSIAKKEEFKQEVDSKNKETDNQTIWLMFFGFLVVAILLFKK